MDIGRASKFESDGWHDVHCQKCRSGVRTRLLWAAFMLQEKFGLDRLIRHKEVLHFAPEKRLGYLLRKVDCTYHTVDFLAKGYTYDNLDYNADISNMTKIPNESYDCLIACDVLEHVNDDLSAMSEIYRVLRKKGFAILTVPQKDGLIETFEDSSIDTPERRKEMFGQRDHLRIYGSDFITKLENSGFEVSAIDETFFDKAIVKKHILFPPKISPHPLATNHRKVFFAQKL